MSKIEFQVERVVLAGSHDQRRAGVGSHRHGARRLRETHVLRCLSLCKCGPVPYSVANVRGAAMQSGATSAAK